MVDLAVVVVGTKSDLGGAAVTAGEVAAFCTAAQQKLGGRAVQYVTASATEAGTVAVAFGRACAVAYAIGEQDEAVLGELELSASSSAAAGESDGAGGYAAPVAAEEEVVVVVVAAGQEEEEEQVILSETEEEVEVQIGERLFIVDLASGMVFQIVPEEQEIGSWDDASRRIRFEEDADDGAAAAAAAAEEQKRASTLAGPA